MHASILFLHDGVCFFRFISVQDRIRESRIKGPSNIGAVIRSVFLTMSVNPFMNTLQTIALKELTKFTGDPSQKVTQFINAIEQIGTFTELNDSMLHSLATIKLDGAAFNWYDNNKTLNVELTPAIFLKIARTIEFDYEEH